LKNWPSVDLVIICGDFQAVRNGQDLNTMSVPYKYREMGDFHKYYSGDMVAPYLTIFIGGNHEASAHGRELYYGGWAAPNIYYLGAANVLKLGPLRIAGLTGIFKKFDFRKPHIERLPFTQDDVKSIYHVRDLDVRKLLSIRTQVDVGLSHDWPEGIAWLGDHHTLFRHKQHFRQDAEDNRLGSPPAMDVLNRLRPPYWFSGHMHYRYVAEKTFNAPMPVDKVAEAPAKNEDEIDLDLDGSSPEPATAGEALSKNVDEIDLDIDENSEPEPTSTETIEPEKPKSEVPESLRAQLPASFSQPTFNPSRPQYLAPFTPFPHPTAISNTRVHFLALDKILANREFLQLIEIKPTTPEEFQRPLSLSYDPEWLAITRAYSSTNPTTNMPLPSNDPAELQLKIDTELDWVKNHVTDLTIPLNFTITAPVYDQAKGRDVPDMPREYNNPQLGAFCELTGIENFFHDTEEEQLRREREAPAETRGIVKGTSFGGGNNRGRGGHRGNRGGGGRGGQRGAWVPRGRGRGRGGSGW
jgi:lariat debranching enzyme